MLRSPIGWRLCSSANNLNTYTAGTDLRAPGKGSRGEDYAKSQADLGTPSGRSSRMNGGYTAEDCAARESDGPNPAMQIPLQAQRGRGPGGIRARLTGGDRAWRRRQRSTAGAAGAWSAPRCARRG